MPGSCKWPLSFRFPDQNPVWGTSPLLHTHHMSCPFQPPWFFHPISTGWRIQIKELLIMQFSEVTTSSPLRPKHLPQFLMSDSCVFRVLRSHHQTVWLLWATRWNNEPIGRQSHRSACNTDIQGGSNMTGTDFFFCNHNCQTLTCTCQSSMCSPNPSRREGGGCGFTLSRSHSCCAVWLVYTQISPSHIWTTLYIMKNLK